jgi:hypothetical protein
LFNVFNEQKGDNNTDIAEVKMSLDEILLMDAD